MVKWRGTSTTCSGIEAFTMILDKTGFGVRYSRGEAFCVECELAFDLKKLPEPYVCPVCRRRVRSRRH